MYNHISDTMTVDSWGTAMTAMLQPHKTQRNSFQCPTHLSFVTKDPLDACPHCERQQRLSLQERRQSVEQQLKDMEGSSSNLNSNSRNGGGNNRSSSGKAPATQDILSELQSTMNQWKQQPTASAAVNNNQRTNGSANNASVPQQQTSPYPAAQPLLTSSGNIMQQSPSTLQPHLSAATGTSNTASAVGAPPPPPQTFMQPPAPPMVPSFGTAPPPPPGGGSPLDALALQIQGMQRMQDWMLYQKEQECQQLRQRLDAATQQINSLAVENALLQEKLNQQEQRMKHELKLIKLAAMQQRNKNQQQQQANGNNMLVPVSGASRSGASTASQQSNTSGANHHNQNNPNNMNNSDFAMFPSDPMEQPKTAVVSSALTRQDSANLFQSSASSANNSHSAPENGEQHQQQQPAQNQSGSVSTQQTRNGGGGGSVFSETPSSVHSQEGSAANNNNTNNKDAVISAAKRMGAMNLDPTHDDEKKSTGPIDLDDLTDLIKANGDLSPTGENEDFGYNNRTGTSNIPRDIQIDPESAGSNGAATNNNSSNDSNITNKAIPPLRPPPEKTASRSSVKNDQEWLEQQGSYAMTPEEIEDKAVAETTPAPVLVNFPDSDNMSLGNTVASSTYGEDRQQVTNQVILDPYGDKGTYTGVILRSTGMPHGSGRMIYQEDKRTYDGEWRHGRWHGYGMATFANGDKYQGEYRFDQRHGKGRYEWKDGRIYDGNFREDKRHGTGKFTWPDGAVYEGDFKDGQREGYGMYSFSDGGKYDGSWKDGRYNGYGTCQWEDGRCYKGEWLKGMAHGKGVETFADGSIRHDGQWIEDEPVIS